MRENISSHVRANMKYRKKTYAQITVDVPKETAAAFKLKCSECGISQASVLKEAIEEFLERGVIRK